MTPVPPWTRRVLDVLPADLYERLKCGLIPARVVPRRKLQTAARVLLAPRRRIYAHPPTRWAVLTRIAAYNGYWLEADPERPHDVALNGKSGRPMSSPAGVPVLNGRLVSNRKSNVAAVFESVFGYSLAVDPTTHAGAIVEKSEVNAAHDGRVLHGPVGPADVHPDRAYQRLVDTTDDDGRLVDYRTPLYGGRPPLVYVKRRGPADLFHNRNAVVEITDPADAFSADELDRLAVLADAMGLDYGEVDVLRDRADGRIYVVDVNQGPSGPPETLAPPEREVAARRLAAAFDLLVEQAIAGRPLAAGPAPGAHVAVGP